MGGTGASGYDQTITHQKKARGITIGTSHGEYDSPCVTTRTLTAQVRGYVKNMITGAAQMDGAIWFVQQLMAPPQRVSILLSRRVGIPYIVVF